MSRITKLLWFCLVGVLLWLMVPVFLRDEMDKRDRVAGGIKALGPAFLKVQRDKGNAILLARPRGRRGYAIVVDGNRDYETRLGYAPYKTPVPVPVKVGSRLYFQYRHFGYPYRVTNINTKGINLEVGGDRRSLFFHNQTVFLPWK